MSNESRDQKAHKNKKRPDRIPLSSGNKLFVPAHIKKEGYQYYWEVDHPGRIEQLESAWWEKVRLDNGEFMTVPAGNGKTHYLMHIEQKYYDEDIDRQQKRNIDASARQAQTLGDSEYVPKDEAGNQRQNVAERQII